MRTISVLFVMVIMLFGNVLAEVDSVTIGKLLIEYESRTSSDDKVNFWYRTDNFEVYVLRTNNFEFEFGPIHHVGPFSFTTKFGGVWDMKKNTPHAMLCENIVLKFSRFTCVSVNEFSLKGSSFNKPKIDWVYNEGFVVVQLGGRLSNCSVGAFYEHYRKDGTDEVWVVGPRVDYKPGANYLKKITFWGGFTDNPTAGIFFYFGT